jgi:transcriptional regulator with XRE-family HTH domain
VRGSTDEGIEKGANRVRGWSVGPTRESRDFTQTQLEKLSGVKQSTISKILTADDYTPSVEVLTKLFRSLGLKLTDILNESDRLPDEILGYLATPLTGLSDAADAELRRVVRTINDIASEPQSGPRFEIYWPGDHTHQTQHGHLTESGLCH